MQHWIAALVEALRDAPSMSAHSDYAERTSNEGEGSPSSSYSPGPYTPMGSYLADDSSPYSPLPQSTINPNLSTASQPIMRGSTPGKTPLRPLSIHEHEHIMSMSDMMQDALLAKEEVVRRKEQQMLAVEEENNVLRSHVDTGKAKQAEVGPCPPLMRRTYI
jgi:hypothetical protein